MTVYPLQANFVSGEISPKLHGRVDTELYGTALALARNWIVMPQGGITRRPGSMFLCELRDEAQTGRLLKFEFSEDQAYAMIFNDGYIRFAADGGLVALAGQDIAGISQADPAVVTYVGADTYANGDRIRITGVAGMTECNNREYIVAGVDAGTNTFALKDAAGVDVDSTGYGAYAGGGVIREIVEIAHGYDSADLFGLHTAQSADTINLAHQGYAPALIARAAETSWSVAAIGFEDGPWLDEDTQGTRLTPAATGGVVIAMTGNSTSSYTAADSASSSNAWLAFDRDLSTEATAATVTGWLSIDFPSTDIRVADAYWIIASSDHPDRAPTHWTFEGYDGSNWIVLDARASETAWVPGEVRYYEFPNSAGYQGYRLRYYAVDGATSFAIKQLGIHERAESQTAFDLTASATTAINGGAGFKTTDVGRAIRLLGSDGRWRWARIAARTSSTVVTVRLYGHALLDLQPVIRWQLSAWSEDDGYPATVAFYQDRLGWAGSLSEPRREWLSRPGDYFDHGRSNPAVESDGIAASLAGGKLDKIVFTAAFGDALIIGTAGDVKALGPSSNAEPFSSFNISVGHVSGAGAAGLQPIVADKSLLYVDRYRKRVMEIVFSAERGGYVTRPLSRLSEHLYAPGIVEGFFQDDRSNLVGHVIADGTMAAMTYEPEHGLAGVTSFELGASKGQVSEGLEILANPGFAGDLSGWTANLWAWGGGDHAVVEFDESSEGSEILTNPGFSSDLSGWTVSPPGFWEHADGAKVVNANTYGPNLIVNGTFDSDLSGWGTGGFVSWITGAARVSSSQPLIPSYIQQTLTTVAGAQYRVRLDFANVVNPGVCRIYIDGSLHTELDPAQPSATVTFIAAGTSTTIRFRASTTTGFQMFLDNISVEESYQFPADLSQTIATVASKSYRIRATITGNAGETSMGVYWGDSLLGNMTADGSYEFTAAAAGPSTTLRFRAVDSALAGTIITSSSVKELIPPAYPATLSQSVATTPGADYTLRIAVALNAALKTVPVYFGGAQIGTIRNVGTHTFDVTATAGVSSVSFPAADASFAGVALAEVSLKEVLSDLNTDIESAVAVPSAGGSTVYMIVRRAINGVARRYVEYFAPRHESGDALASAVYFDCAFRYDGEPTNEVTGLTWLIGETIGVAMNGVDIGDVEVDAAGTIELPAAGSKITGGLRYVSRARTLRPPTAGNRDGTSFGRPRQIVNAALDLLDTAGLRVGSPGDTRPFPHGDYVPSPSTLATGVYPNVPVDDVNESGGELVIETDRGYPATVRAMIVGLEGAP